MVEFGSNRTAATAPIPPPTIQYYSSIWISVHRGPFFFFPSLPSLHPRQKATRWFSLCNRLPLTPWQPFPNVIAPGGGNCLSASCLHYW
ncbi:unnamed protein product [Periconia digitata]|uniref:Uncharacterized protein n=1 Tax=Periconia digitata TaxID=1303443 RepID=A0A9W4U930_9PLEO|nr:unnamed protein product [Periconia digitata]